METVKKIERPRVLLASHLALAEHGMAIFSACLPEGFTFEDTLKPEFWSAVAHRFKAHPLTNRPDLRGAYIFVSTVDQRFIAWLHVSAVMENGLAVECFGPAHDAAGNGMPHYLGAKAAKALDKVAGDEKPFSVRYNVGRRGFDVIRRSDGQVVNDAAKCPRKEDALAWIEKTTDGLKAA